MAGERDINATLAFLDVAQSQSLLTPQAAADLTREAAARNITAAQLAVEKGVLDPVQVDLVESLLLPADTFPGYEIVDVLGQGGMGVVYRARQKNLQRLVAIKTILVSQIAMPGAVARFEQEALSVAKLRHPNIVTAYDFGRQSGRLYFVMELLEGETLENRLVARGALSESAAWGIIRQTASGLAHAVEQGVVHRDIKPANLFLLPPPAGFSLSEGLAMVKITDFGLAMLAAQPDSPRLTRVGTSLGTPAYMAPEQVSNPNVDFRADIYALGATAYHMLTGQTPFAQSTVWEIMTRKLHGELPDLPTLGLPSSAALIAAMMAQDPTRRPGSYAEVLERIDRLEAKRTTVSVQPPIQSTHVASTPAKPARPRRRMAPALAIGLLALAIAGAAAWKWWPAPVAVVPPNRAAGPVVPLFDGESLSGWIVGPGLWKPAKDEEDGSVLSGRGHIRRPLPELSDFKIAFSLDLHKAERVEVHFGVPQSDPQRRLVLRIVPDGIVLGRRLSPTGEFEVKSKPIPYPKPDREDEQSRYHRIALERIGNQWFTILDETVPIGTIKSEGGEVSEFELVVDGGDAYFDNFELTVLRPAGDTGKP